MSSDQRLHVAAIPLRLVRLSLGMIPPLLAGTIATELGAVFLLVGLLFGLAASVTRWACFHWRVDEASLVIREGLVTRKQRILPLERIQAVELVRPLGHRLLGVVQVRIEAAGSGAAEGQIDALSPEVAHRLRAVLLGESGEPDEGDADEEGVPLVRVAPATLVLAGATGGRVGVVAALLGTGSEFLADRFEQLFALPTRLGVVGTLTLVGLAVLVAFLASLAATVAAYWGFTLRAGDDALLVRRGLLEQRLDTVPLRRIQALTVEENALRRPLGRAAVRVVIAGRPGDQAQQTGVLLPLGRRTEAFALVERVLAADGLSGVRLVPMPGRARTRRLVRAVVVTVVTTAGLVVWAGPRGLLGLALAGPLIAWAVAAYRALGHGEHAGILVARSGALVRRTAFVPTDRLQSLELSAGILQRRVRLATLALQIPGPGGYADPRWIDLDRRTGETLLGQLAEAIPS